MKDILENEFSIISIHASAKEATVILLLLLIKELISIHASAKEATLSWFYFIIAFYISIHASAKEATSSKILALIYSNFNPRLREGGDAFWRVVTP